MSQNFKQFCGNHLEWFEPNQTNLQQLPETISDFTEDSRCVMPGSIFFATTGQGFNGQNYVEHALSRGAIAAVVPMRYEAKQIPKERLIFSKQPNELLSLWAQQWFGYPDHYLRVIGVTGTNGKTSVCQLTETLLNQGQERPLWANLGTLGLRVDQTTLSPPLSLKTLNTTPNPKTFFGTLQFLKEQGYEGVVCEVSSHGIALSRVAGCEFQSAAFTNLSHDHLDFHQGMSEYFEVKASFLRQVGKRLWINGETSEGRTLVRQFPQSNMFGHQGRLWLKEAIYHPDHVVLNFLGEGFKSPLRVKTSFSTGLFPENIGLALGLASEWRTLPRVLDLSHVQVPGRCEFYQGRRGQQVIIDYAHTPDALMQVIQRLRKVFNRGQLIVIFGCGGDRDRRKRPIMGKVAATYADRVVLTSDNPRSEDPEAIVREIYGGIPASDRDRISQIVNRAEALQHVLRGSQEGDIVLIAGKGHERYQIIAGTTYPFNDLDICRPYLVPTISLPSLLP